MSSSYSPVGGCGMRYSPILLFHICAGTIGFLAGALAVAFPKGSEKHAVAGSFFTYSMWGLAASGVYMALVKSQPGNVLGGTLTFYLVATAWMTIRQKSGQNRIGDWGALMVSLALLAFTITCGIEAWLSPTGMKYAYPPGPYFFLGTVALTAATGDTRKLMRGGVFGRQRLSRHLWRMCFAWFIAAGSIFLARQQLFPAFMQKTGMLYLLSFLPLVLMVFWLIRVRFSRVFRNKRAVIAEKVCGLPSESL